MYQKSRYSSVDSLRGLAVLLMVMVHAAATWNPYSSTQATFLAYIVAGLGGLAAPLFVTIFGWGLTISKSTFSSNIIKAIILLLLQIIVNLTSPHLFNIFTPGILSLFAILLLLKPIILYFSKSSGNLITGVLLLCSILIISIHDPSLQGDDNWNARISTESITILLSHLLISGTYPVIPWIMFAIIGAFLGNTGKEGNDTLPRNYTFFLLIIIGLSYCIITLLKSLTEGSLWAHPTRGDYLNFFPANLGFMIAATTGVMLVWAITIHLKLYMFKEMGRVSLTVYVLHFIPLSLSSNFQNEYSWNYMEASLAVAAYTTAWLFFAYIWKNFQWLTIENLIRKFTN